MSDNTTLYAEHKAMVTNLAKPGEDILRSLKPHDCDRIHHTFGVNSELAEIIIASREWHRLSRDGIREEVEANNKKLTEERGDWEFYLEGKRQNLGIERNPDRTPPEHVARELGEVLLDLAVAASLLMDPTKRIFFYRKHEIQLTPEQNEAALVDQNNRAADCLDHIDEVLEEWGVIVGVTREEALEANIRKLLKGERPRYKAGVYSDAAGAGRDDKGGHDQDLDNAPNREKAPDGPGPDWKPGVANTGEPPVDGRSEEEKAAQAAGVIHTSEELKANG